MATYPFEKSKPYQEELARFRELNHRNPLDSDKAVLFQVATGRALSGILEIMRGERAVKEAWFREFATALGKTLAQEDHEACTPPPGTPSC